MDLLLIAVPSRALLLGVEDAAELRHICALLAGKHERGTGHARDAIPYMVESYFLIKETASDILKLVNSENVLSGDVKQDEKIR